MHWREKELLNVLKNGKLTTTEIVSRVNMSKATALKYLDGMKEKNLVDGEEIGTTKIWFLKNEEEIVEKKIKILIADDDKNVIDIVRYSIDDQYEILEAANGKEALGMVFARSPDILVLDIMMPEMDGYMVCKELKEHDSTKNLPIIILSAKATVEDKLKAIGFGIDDYMIKPFDPRELEARIKMRLKRTSMD
ncbi:MAG: transcriptional regulator [Candidatus Methanoperedens nitroreducens]|uniref:Transcriptional regulator n=1 Tax=Candidatus Methanoperedens nitratireducens TaxID=1392998 RepID=A0A0P7ZKH6_9EURY|nr:response regulator [Candidatus Methanoperedens sp. BLZ2]KAB2945148.1 MAG: response regulator [Candidatus Methanoperedens sp.]KPQ44559.1 MAG: transcriptional regulator [Candidatus Methanoperedens sp. BLZ1]MBZ0173645.1 response regulator [Candidatus Methanoperedens nitroreducens]CAG1007116.1 Alkaline phosphatase synthesis transcriptional regulatory protein PhoP [Methanosarcinales archaeon]MCX9077357.1 response regulator [Candidatus Methanoperedens sp.]